MFLKEKKLSTLVIIHVTTKHFSFFYPIYRMIFLLLQSLPSIYSQECYCEVDTSQKTALPCSLCSA